MAGRGRGRGNTGPRLRDAWIRRNAPAKVAPRARARARHFERCSNNSPEDISDESSSDNASNLLPSSLSEDVSFVVSRLEESESWCCKFPCIRKRFDEWDDEMG